jgi:GT2 family glycosyltransferase
MPETTPAAGGYRYDVAVIIINYNSSQFTLDCVASIVRLTPASCRYQVVVVDNNSREEELAKLSGLSQYKEVTLVRSVLNVGFSGGNMLGVQEVNAEFLFFLNNDCVLLNDCLGRLADFARQHPQTAICSAQMFEPDGRFHHSFGYFPSVKTKLLGVGLLRSFTPGRYPSHKKQYNQPLEVDLVSGSALFVRASYFAEVGGFDTNYFLYCEEEDLALRFRRRGYRVYVVPEAQFMHYGGGSTVRNLAVEREYYISLFYYFRKHHQALEVFLLQLLYFFKNFRKFYRSRDFVKLAFFILRGAPMRESLRFSQKIRYRSPSLPEGEEQVKSGGAGSES